MLIGSFVLIVFSYISRRLLAVKGLAVGPQLTLWAANFCASAQCAQDNDTAGELPDTGFGVGNFVGLSRAWAVIGLVVIALRTKM